MKTTTTTLTTTTSLLIALGLASSAAVAQTQASPGAGGVQTDSQAGQQSQYYIGPSNGMQPGSQPGAPANATSGSSSGVPSSTGTLGPQSGAQSGMPPHPSSGTSGMPAASTDTSGPQPGTAAPPVSGASGTHSGTQSGMPFATPPDPYGGTGDTAQPDMPPLPGSSERQAQPSAGAQPSAPGAASPSPVARLQPKTEDGVTYLCGGAGKEERVYLKRQASKHDMLLTFADRKGELIADVNVAIKDAKGNTVLETKCDGPMMLVDLPKGGKYRVRAEANGYAMEHTVAVNKAPGKRAQQVATVVLNWPTRVARAEAPVGTATGASGTSGAGAAGGKSEHNR